jgi:hypothetical protein
MKSGFEEKSRVPPMKERLERLYRQYNHRAFVHPDPEDHGLLQSRVSKRSGQVRFFFDPLGNQEGC